MGYSKRAVVGFGWLGLLKVLTKGLSIVKIIVLSRILSPRDFGIFGITVAVLALVEKFTETGINTFLIQKEDALTKYINSAWVIALIRGALISLLLLISTKVLPGFYKEPSLLLFLLVASAIPIIKGLINPSEITFWKQMHYHKEAIFRGTLAAIETFGSIFLVLLLHSPIGLIYALVISAVVEVVLSHLFISPRPRLQANWPIVREILHASKYLNMGVVLSFLVTNADNLIIGKVLGTTQLGYYQNGYNVAASTTGDLGDLGAQTVFPIYTKIRGDRKRLSTAFFRSLVALAITAAIPPLVIMIRPELAVRIVLGARWLPIVPFLPFLFAAMYVRALNGIMYPVFIAIEKMHRNVIILAVQLVSLVVLIIPMSLQFGLTGASIAVLASYVIIQPLFVLFMAKSLRGQ